MNIIKKNVLIFPAGTEIGLEIFNALKYSKFVKIYGGTSKSDHSDYLYKDILCNFPFVNDAGFLLYLNRIIDTYKIDCVYPAHDDVSVFLSNNASNIHCQVIITDKDTTNILRDKYLTYEYLKDYDFIPNYTINADNIKIFPIFAKPRIGQGANGACKIDDANELNIFNKQNQGNEYIYCEYLPNEEITVDCFTDIKNNLISINQRTRDRIRNGIAIRSRNICDDKVSKIAKTINDNFKFKGAWFFQLKKTIDQKYKLLEISPRIPGTSGLTRNRGINLPLLTLFTYWGYDVSIINNNYNISVDRALDSVYKLDISYNNVYVDYDDTLVIDDRVNEMLMQYLYQLTNEGKKIFLITKHNIEDIFNDIEKHKISKNLFDDIIIINKGENKAKYIKSKDSIFIDDSFAERKIVSDEINIPVFDLDMISSLVNPKY